MTTHRIVSREEWTAARMRHLAKEKELTRLREENAVELVRLTVVEGVERFQRLFELLGGDVFD